MGKIKSEQVLKKAIIIGASAGIGRELALELAREGYILGLTARRLPLLHELAGEITTRGFVRKLDVREPERARAIIEELASEMGGVDVIILNAGIIFQDPSWEQELETIKVNVIGFAAIFNIAFNHFTVRGGGHIVGISSVAAIRGGHGSPVYNASKAFISSLMHGCRIKARRLRLPIYITDIRPGHVCTSMLEGQRGVFWAIPTDVAARQIVRAITRKMKHAYITPRWRAVAWALRLLPDWLYCRFES